MFKIAATVSNGVLKTELLPTLYKGNYSRELSKYWAININNSFQAK